MAYKILWAYRYESYYMLLCEEFLIPLYWIIFLKEPNYLYRNAMVVISVYGEYYFSQEGTYIKMYGCSWAPSLFPRNETDFVVNKEVVRNVFINGIGSYLHDMKKTTFPLFLFCIRSYKFSKVKGAKYFVRDLEMFHFGENSFTRNDSRGKAAEIFKAIKIHFEYTKLFGKD